MAKALDLWNFAQERDFAHRWNTEVRRYYEGLPMLPPDYVECLVALPKVIKGSFSLSSSSRVDFPIDDTGMAAFNIASHLHELTSHPACPIGHKHPAIPKTHCQTVLRAASAIAMPAARPAPGAA
jgi:hypothetical protein